MNLPIPIFRNEINALGDFKGGVKVARDFAPELNPVENVWEYLRGNKLSNTIYENYDDILEKACQAWMFFANDKERVTSITTRQWAKVNL